MKKELLYFAMLVLTLAGCQSEEDLDTTQVPLTFGVEVKAPEMDTRAAVTDLSNLESNGFCLYAVMTDASTGHLVPYMTNQEVKWESDSWTYSPVKYWPNSGQEITFYAVQNDPNGNLQRATDWDYSPALTYTNPTQMSKQTDLLWAPAVTASKESVDGAVQFSFQHALAAFRFCARKTTDLPLTIQKIELTGYFPQQAQLLCDAESVETAWYYAGKRQLATYTLQSTDDATTGEPAALKTDEVSTTLASVQKESTHLLTVIPVSETSYTLTVSYTLNGVEKTATYTADKVDLVAGHVYQLNLVF